MFMHPRAGKLAKPEDLIDVNMLINRYFESEFDINELDHQVAFGTSGHRGSSLRHNFTEKHIMAIAQAIVEVRQQHNVTGPCFIGKDTHALSDVTFDTVLAVLTANRVPVFVQSERGFTPTPAVSRAILMYNADHADKADGIVITPSHNPPADGGIKYNATNGGPADTDLTKAIETRANALLREGLMPAKYTAIDRQYVHEIDYVNDYVLDLVNVVDMSAIQESNLTLAVDPLGGAGIAYWQRIAEHYRLNLTITNDKVDPTFKFMHLDHDGVIRMDCSSSSVMTGLLNLKSSFDLAFANDPDFDRHGIITRDGLMNPNHYLSAAINYIYAARPEWKADVAVGKTLVSSAMIDKVVHQLGRQLYEFPVGFKWFVDGLYSGKIGFAGEESAGASFLRRNGQVWSTDKDGIILCLLAAEMMAKTGKSPQAQYNELEAKFGRSYYSRIQAPATSKEKQILSQLKAEQLTANTLAGDKIIKTLTTAPANHASIGGLKVMTDNGWFTARPSGTEESYKVYCESFVSQAHLDKIEQEAVSIVKSVMGDD